MVSKVKPSQLKNQNLVLIINTVVPGEILLMLFGRVKYRKKIVGIHSDKLLFYISEVLRKNKIKISNIKGIIVVSGPGSFTAVRIGVAVANTFGFALRIPVVDIKLSEFKNEKELIRFGMQKLKKAKVGQIVLPFYGKEPNITKPRKLFRT